MGSMPWCVGFYDYTLPEHGELFYAVGQERGGSCSATRKSRSPSIPAVSIGSAGGGGRCITVGDNDDRTVLAGVDGSHDGDALWLPYVVKAFMVFAPLVPAVHMTNSGTPITAAACAIYFFARAAHFDIGIFGVPVSIGIHQR